MLKLIVLSVFILCVSSEEIPKLLQNDGSHIPMVGLGTGGKPNYQAIMDGIDVGVRLIDTAIHQNSEKNIGKALKDSISAGKVKRSDLYIISKLEAANHERSKVPIGIKESLAGLGLDYLDLFIIHHPETTVDLLETWHGMEDVQKMGLTKSIGLSNFNEEQIDRILANGTIKPAVNEVQCNPYHNQKKHLSYLKMHNITLIAWRPLGGEEQHLKFLNDTTLTDIAAKHQVSSAQVSLRYNVQRGVVVIPKSMNKVHIQENLNLFNFTLTEEDMNKIDAMNKGN